MFNLHLQFTDEFQDTDDVQIETITGLQHIFGEQCKLFIVGDLKQSIYRFRGASLSAFDKAMAVDGVTNWNTYSLSRNYRTDRRLLDRFHDVFSQLGMKKLLPYIEGRDRLQSHIIKEYKDEDLICRIDTHFGDRDVFYQDFFNEVHRQLNLLKRLNEHEKLSKEEKIISILVRYNWQIRDIVNEAEKYGISVKITEGGDLFRLPSTRDLHKLVMAITHPRNEVYLMNLIMSNYVSLSVNMVGLAGKKQSEKKDELIKILDEYFMLYMGKSWEQLIVDFETRPVLVVLREIYEITKPWCYFRDKELQLLYRQNFECIIEKITNKYVGEYLTINKVLEFLKINVTTYQEEASRGGSNVLDEVQVICTTIHKSKGLEYGTVILPFMNEDISNINLGGIHVNYVDGKISYGFYFKKFGMDCNSDFNKNLEIEEKLQEESRILYVAMTRAIRNVVWFNDMDSNNEHCWVNYMEVAE